MNYLSQVQRGIDYIEEHLERDLELRSVSKVAGISHWHFQRTFKALTGETLKTYVRARRLANAATRLRGEGRIIDIAIAAGFESQAAFSRAFKRTFGHTPGEYRRLGNRHLFLTKVQIDRDYLEHLHSNVSLEPEITERDAMELVGMRTTFFSVDSEKNNIGEQLPPLWDAFLPRLGDIQRAVHGTCYGVIQQDDIESDRLSYHAAIEVRGALPSSLPRGLARIEVPRANYAIFAHRGLASDIDRTVNYIYSTWLTQSGRRHTYGPDLELYGAEWHATSAESVMHYAIPIE